MRLVPSIIPLYRERSGLVRVFAIESIGKQAPSREIDYGD
jgi:hypothetical protein